MLLEVKKLLKPEPQRWLSSSECLLPLRKTLVWLLVPIGGSQSPITPSTGLCGHLHSGEHTKNRHIIKNLKRLQDTPCGPQVWEGGLLPRSCWVHLTGDGRHWGEAPSLICCCVPWTNQALSITVLSNLAFVMSARWKKYYLKTELPLKPTLFPSQTSKTALFHQALPTHTTREARIHTWRCVAGAHVTSS